ncbi:hypothetical protein JCM19241_5124 [Vibrio ishigakensis]|uniref:Uncharacterized protein n=2 Tax=Vibrio ishigakensis TaxID=1481914 RepID=A0A0B8QFK3_9VIBR|nr:hypothetical protein JCM19241_5124 [Vibrio ishigakensis]
MGRVGAIVALGVLFANGLQAKGTDQLHCMLSETQDHFIYYPSQLVYASEQFAIFQNFKGRVTTQVDLKTEQMHRTTFIGEPFDPEYQILKGHCKGVGKVIRGWQRENASKNPLL